MKKLALTDFAKYRYPSALELSPDSRYLTFALKEVDREGDGYRWNLWLYDLERRESRQITQGDDQRKSRTKRCGRGASRKSGRCITA